MFNRITQLSKARILAGMLIGLSISLYAASDARAAPAQLRPTVVLVHGAFADSSSWGDVPDRLTADGYHVVAVANPLRALQFDANYVARTAAAVEGPVVLVGHSYGGAVITNAALAASNVRALVYVAALAPAEGETAFDLVGKIPGSILGKALGRSVVLDNEQKDMYVDQAKFKAPFAADLADPIVKKLAAAQRPVTEQALTDKSGAPAWAVLPSWFIYGDADMSVPPAAHNFMAQRAHASKLVVEKGGSHLLMLSHPAAVVQLIEEAARAVTN